MWPNPHEFRVIPKIDVHTHMLPPNLPRWAEKFGYSPFMELHQDGCSGKLVWDDGRFIREVKHNLWDEEARLHDCDREGVRVQVLSTVPAMFSYGAKPQHGNDVARFLNDHLAEVVSRHPTRFLGLGTLPLQAPELAVRELERMVLELGLTGVQIGSHINAWNLSDPALFPVFERAAELGASIFVHPWDMMGQDKMPKYWLPWLVAMPAEVSLALCSMIFGGVFERLPRLKICFAHGGGSFPATLGRIDQGFRARPDLCAVDNSRLPSSYVGRFFVDSLAYEPKAFALIRSVIGDSHICLGSDYPFPLGEDHPGALMGSLGLSEDLVRKFFYENALKWLGKTAEEMELK